jgi:CMP-N,N'-diacetyllegionaminic acid synthase
MKNYRIAAIIGYGSIGKRHARVLDKIKIFKKIYVVTKRKIKCKYEKVKLIKDLKFINPDYFLICSETSNHFRQLKFINENFKKKTIFVEKPLFNKNYNLKIKNNNKIYIGYNFRFHPIIQFLKKKIKNKKILSATILSGSYLPNWRKNISYKESYSGNHRKGGGVLLDLSHEFDYTSWILGKLKMKYCYYKKISNLDISSKDFLSFIGSSLKSKYVQINLDYFSRISKRLIILEGNNFSFHADLIKNIVRFKYFSKLKLFMFNKSALNKTYLKQHLNILFERKKIVCTYKEGLNLLNFFKAFNI